MLAALSVVSLAPIPAVAQPQEPCLADADCDDGVFCNGVDRCDLASGLCGAVSACPPSIPPTVCNEETDTCDPSGCQSDADCDDGVFCNGIDRCDLASGFCGAVSACPPSIPPTVCNEETDTCDPGGCLSDADCGADGLFCNGEPTCDLATGECQFALAPCPPAFDVCVVRNGFCDEENDQCVDIADDSLCDDGQFCNGVERCDFENDACVSVSSCPPSIPPTVCNEETDTCDPSGCQSDADCDDGVSCTVDSCDLATGGCTNRADDARCGNGSFCDGTETCNPLSGCQMGPDPCRAGQVCLEDQDRCESTPPPDRVCLQGCSTDRRACRNLSREALSTCRGPCFGQRQSDLDDCDLATDPRERAECRRTASAAFRVCQDLCRTSRSVELASCTADFDGCRAGCRQ